MKYYKRKKLNIVNGSLKGLKTLIFGLVILIWMFGGSTISGGTEPPFIMVRPTIDWVDGNCWPIGVLVTLTIDDLSNGVSVDHMDTQTVTESGQFRFKLGDYFDIQQEHFVVVTDGETTREHIVTNLEVTSVDTQFDTVSGTADPGDEIDVSIWDPVHCEISVSANESGDWSADFSICNVDIVPGTWGCAQERDVVGDYTIVDWELPNEPPIAVCKNIEISADENCEAYIIPEDIDGGSYDPDGDDISLSVDKLGPYVLGEHCVSLTVTDESGESDTCQAKVTVVDTSPPNINLSDPIPVKIGEGQANVASKLTINSTDNCQIETLSIDKVELFNKAGEPVPIVGKGLVKVIGNDVYIYLRSEGWSVCVTATASDESGNSNTVRICKFF